MTHLIGLGLSAGSQQTRVRGVNSPNHPSPNHPLVGPGFALAWLTASPPEKMGFVWSVSLNSGSLDGHYLGIMSTSHFGGCVSNHPSHLGHLPAAIPLGKPGTEQFLAPRFRPCCKLSRGSALLWQGTPKRRAAAWSSEPKQASALHAKNLAGSQLKAEERGSIGHPWVSMGMYVQTLLEADSLHAIPPISQNQINFGPKSGRAHP